MTNPAQQTRKKRVTLLQGADIVNILRKAYDGQAGKYLPEWSDKKVMEAADAPSLSAIEDLRRQMFGNYKQHPPRAKRIKFTELLDAIGSRVERIERELGLHVSQQAPPQPATATAAPNGGATNGGTARLAL